MATYISIYDYQDYKTFIVDWIELAPNKGRGQRIKLAEALGCQTPFITHVLTGDYHFSLEQAEACSRWMGLNESDSEFFVLMVLKQKAATKPAMHLLERQLSKRRNEENVLKKRLKIKEGLTSEDQMQYYSQSWYALIHMALMQPRLQTIEGLMEYFQLSRHKIVSILDFLAETKLIEFKNDTASGMKKIVVKSPMIHLEKSSPLLAHHHANFRLKAIDAIKDKQLDNLHYSTVISLSEKDYDWVRSKISLLLEELADRVKKSDDEQLGVLNIDWFKV